MVCNIGCNIDILTNLVDMTIVPILWYRPNKDKEYFIKIRLTDKKNVRYVNLNISIPKKYWYKNKVTNQHPESKRLNDLINQTVYELKSRVPETEFLSKPSSEQKIGKSKSNSAVHQFPDKTVGSMLNAFIEEFSSNGNIATAKKHKVVLKHTIQSKIDLIGLEEFDTTHVNQFRSYLISRGIQPQGRHTYEKTIRKVFNRAIEKGYRTRKHPFTGMRSKIPKAAPPRYISIYKLHEMEERLIFSRLKTDLPRIASTMFLFSTYSYGMRFSDVLTLRWNNIQDMKIGYNMRKTKQDIIIKVTAKHANLIKVFLPDNIYPKIFRNSENCYSELKSQGLTNRHPIIDLENEYYFWKIEFIKRVSSLPNKEEQLYRNIKLDKVLKPEEIENFKNLLVKRDEELLRLVREQSLVSNDYIFPLLSNVKKNVMDEYNAISSKNTIINRELKSIAQTLNVSPFSFHASRHSFANNIREVEPDILKISRMLGHHSLSQTQDYLKRFERMDEYQSNDKFIGVHDDHFIM